MQALAQGWRFQTCPEALSIPTLHSHNHLTS